VHASATAHPAEHETTTGLDNRKLLMWAFLGSDCLFFGSLISTYMIYRGRSLNPPFPGEIFDIPYTSVSAFVLLMSSLTMVLALAALRRDDQRATKAWILATALLGSIFVGGQVFEFTVFVHEGLYLGSNLFGTTFFVLTGFHGTHVTLGIVILLSFFVQAMRGKLRPENSLMLETAGLYWHFVDIVWIVIFTLVYLLPYPEQVTAALTH